MFKYQKSQILYSLEYGDYYCSILLDFKLHSFYTIKIEMHTRLSSPKNRKILLISYKPLKIDQGQIKYALVLKSTLQCYFWENLNYEFLNHKSETHYHKNDVGNAKATFFIHNRTPEKYHYY